MTAFMMNERRALDEFQAEMDAYGLKVSRSTSGCFANEELTAYSLRMRTEYEPVKGWKGPLDVLRDLGYHVSRYGDRDRRTGRLTYRFAVYKTVVIPTKEALA